MNSFTTLNLASPVPQRAALQLYAMYRPLASRRDANTLLDLPFGGEAGRLILLTVREGRDLAAEAGRMSQPNDR